VALQVIWMMTSPPPRWLSRWSAPKWEFAELRISKMHGRDEIVLVEESLRWFLAPDFPIPPAGEPFRLAS